MRRASLQEPPGTVRGFLDMIRSPADSAFVPSMSLYEVNIAMVSWETKTGKRYGTMDSETRSHGRGSQLILSVGYEEKPGLFHRLNSYEIDRKKGTAEPVVGKESISLW